MSGDKPTPARIIEVRADDEPDASSKDGSSKTPAPHAAASGKSKVAPAVAPAAKPASRPASKGGEGLSDEMLTQIAQAKFEAQEDKLRDVARQSLALLRDYKRLSAVDCERRVAEIRKSLLKYEMQYIRAWASQEKRRRAETEVLEAEAERCRQEAEDEDSKIVELKQVLEKERRRRKRYECFERLAEEVNGKKTRPESQAEINAATADIERLKRRRCELEALAEERDKRGQLLRHAVVELKQDLQREIQLGSDLLGPASSPGGADGNAAANDKAEQSAAGAGMEVIS